MKNKIQRIAILSYFCTNVAFGQAMNECTVEQNPMKKAVCVKADYDAHKSRKDSARFTNNFLHEGNNHYSKQRYYKAYRAYDFSTAYLPSSYAYLRASESLFLAYANSKNFEDDNAKSTGSCLLPHRFTAMTDDTLQQYYKVGVELAKIHQYGPIVSPAYLAETEKRISCLEAMATQYRHEKTGCVDIAKLKACMGVKK
jgi:hypothetical protein